MKTHVCGHPCGGVRNESECLPCLLRCSEKITLKQDADDMCMICFTEALSAAPAIQVNIDEYYVKKRFQNNVGCDNIYFYFSITAELYACFPCSLLPISAF